MNKLYKYQPSYSDHCHCDDHHGWTNGLTHNRIPTLEVFYTESNGTLNYNNLAHKPSINGVILEGDLTLEELGFIAGAQEFEEIQIEELDAIIYGSSETEEGN